MSDEQDIHLSQREYEELKDDITFKSRTMLTLKHVVKKLDDLNGIKDDVTSLKTHRNIHWFLISVILSGLFGITFWLIRGIN